MQVVFIRQSKWGGVEDIGGGVLVEDTHPLIRFEHIGTRAKALEFLVMNGDVKRPLVGIVGDDFPMEEWLEDVDRYSGFCVLHECGLDGLKNWKVASLLKANFDEEAQLIAAIASVPMRAEKKRPTL